MQALTSYSESIIYLITFGIVFAETGVVAFFFLPGDTLLFTLGLMSFQGIISLGFIVPVIIIAGFFGNLLGYHLGKLVRDKRHSVELLKRIPDKYVVRTENFYKKFGSLTVVLSRFVPIVRTIAPFLAGASRMNYKKFVAFSLLGAMLWGSIVTTLGYFLAKYIDVAHIEYIGFGLMISASVLTPLAVFLSKKFIKKS
ncbi:MAG: DedA family protein [Candidatus Pacebacteria bacterium]|nr:DedA family protein [Candidatus Paceibacterota bacterium]